VHFVPRVDGVVGWMKMFRYFSIIFFVSRLIVVDMWPRMTCKYWE